jgi:hypothetical protein
MNGFTIRDEVVMIKSTKGETTLVWDKCLNSNGVFVSGIKIVPILNQVANTVIGSKSMIKTMSAEIN